jgi:spore coat polysaccharide biosynthesis predicted glycosyltransferase SpsG
MGGVDKDNTTAQVLDALTACTLHADLHITVVMGPHAPWLAQVQTQAAQMPWQTKVLVGVNNMAELMANSDLAIGAAGGTAWERCSLGLPSLVLVLAQNQLAGAVALQNAGAAVALKSHQQIADYMGTMHTAAFANEVLAKLSHAAAAVTDGQGCAHAANYMIKSVHA